MGLQTSAGTSHLRIGVTGHRANRLSGEDSGRIATTVRALLIEIERTCGLLPAATHGHTLVTCLADGADSLAAQAALAAGWKLDAILPFPRDIYRADFSAPAADQLASLLERARHIIELPGNRSEAEGAPYARAGIALLERSDLLIAAWDGLPGRGEGGTAWVVAQAVERRIPAILVDPAGLRPTEIAFAPDKSASGAPATPANLAACPRWPLGDLRRIMDCRQERIVDAA